MANADSNPRGRSSSADQSELPDQAAVRSVVERVLAERNGMTRAADAPKGVSLESAPPSESWFSAMSGVMVAAVGLLVLLGIMFFALTQLPSDNTRGQNIVALATSSFGVIGAIVGAYFGVRSANRAVDKIHSAQSNGRGQGVQSIS